MVEWKRNLDNEEQQNYLEKKVYFVYFLIVIIHLI